VVADKGNVNAASDAAVGAHMALAAVESAALNVLVNAKNITDSMAVATLHSSVTTLTQQARALHAEVVAAAETRVGLR
jgi:glutamate formiminotransferase/formiminotetrahydrofolate cyclodeaminase